MSFTQSIRTCLRKIFVLSGRASRSEYWWFVLFILLYLLVAGALIYLLGAGSAASGDFLGFFGLPAIVLGIPLVWFYIASLFAAVRRLHDRNYSGWWLGASLILGVVNNVVERALPDGVLLLVIAGVSFLLSIFLLVVMILRGTDGPNRFGEDPKGYVDEEVFA